VWVLVVVLVVEVVEVSGVVKLEHWPWPST